MSEKIKFISKKVKEKWKLIGLNDIAGTDSKIEISGNNQMTVDGCTGVFEYKNDFIRLNLSRGGISVTGVNLTMDVLNEKTIKINGKILNIDFNV